eukprot:TRINITY_DN25515_c1_g1_i2.p2 TRINITY_DN25515_c1_g1~~TRINITY_DN25515_c1_g1_i2.p2  ORF type:complete len:105 (+),score=3.89 TRINITY_DN25515_c1_g1_i2:1-315(+)
MFRVDHASARSIPVSRIPRRASSGRRDGIANQRGLFQGESPRCSWPVSEWPARLALVPGGFWRQGPFYSQFSCSSGVRSQERAPRSQKIHDQKKKQKCKQTQTR